MTNEERESFLAVLELCEWLIRFSGHSEPTDLDTIERAWALFNAGDDL